MPQSSVSQFMNVAFPGMNADATDNADNYDTRVSGETTLQLPFGRMVIAGSTDNLCLSFTASAQARKCLGVVAYNAFNQIASQLGNVADSNGNIGLVAGAPVRIKRRGRLYVAIAENVDPSQQVHVSFDATGGGIGVFRATASGGHSITLTQCARWAGTFTSVQGFGILDFDMRMLGTPTVD